MPDFDVHGRWDKYDADDPANVSARDQLLAETFDNLRSCESYVAIAVPYIDADSDKAMCKVMANLLGYTSRVTVMRSMADLIARMWFDEVPFVSPDDDADYASSLLSAFTSSMLKVMEERWRNDD